MTDKAESNFEQFVRPEAWKFIPPFVRLASPVNPRSEVLARFARSTPYRAQKMRCQWFHKPIANSIREDRLT